MIPLISYKIFKWKQKQKELEMEERKKKRLELAKKRKQVENGEEKVTVKEKTVRKKRMKQKPSNLTVFITAFLAFGVPSLYIIYRHVDRLYRSYRAGEYVDFSESTFYNHWLPDWSRVMSLREKKMQDYKFSHSLHGIDRRASLSLREFYEVYDGKYPVIITDCVTKWPALKKWTNEFFVKEFGNEKVGIMSSEGGELKHGEHVVTSLKEFINKIDESSRRKWKYIQDELFLIKRPELSKDIGICEVLQEDWFQLFPSDIRPWWSFLLWGTSHSRSHLHIDPYNWTGTNAVLSGRKRWKLFPPGQDKLLYVRANERCGFPLDCVKYNSHADSFSQESMNKYPKVKLARSVEFDLLPGELLIIPTGWFHQAYNVEATVAVAGQLLNGRNFRVVLEEIFKGGSIPRGGFSRGVRTLPPRSQVQAVIDRVTSEMLKRGRDTTKFIADQLKNGHSEL